MARFAELSQDNQVMRVIEVDDEIIKGPDGLVNEFQGISFCKKSYGFYSKWVMSMSPEDVEVNPFRKIVAGMDCRYDESNDVFVPNQPFPSWTFNEDTYGWEPPVPQSELGTSWDEESQSWI